MSDNFPPVIQHFNEAQKVPWWYSGAATLAAGGWFYLAAIMLLVMLGLIVPSMYTGVAAVGAFVIAITATSVAYSGGRLK